MLSPHLERILVTGGSGTLGYNIVRALAHGHPESQVSVVLRTPDPTLFGDLPNVTVEQMDMLHTERVSELVRRLQPNAVIHAAASGVRPSSIGYFYGNPTLTLGTL